MFQINLHDNVPVLPFCSDKYFESAMKLSDIYSVVLKYVANKSPWQGASITVLLWQVLWIGYEPFWYVLCGFSNWPHQNLAKFRLKLDTVSYP